MQFIHPNQYLALQMTESIQTHIEDNSMLPVSVETIMQDFESWFAAIGQNQSLAGFFCIRRPCHDFAEMGSVKSFQGVLPQMISKFQIERRTSGEPYGCAITKDHPEKFARLTQGKVLQTFPPWYNRVQSDKHFVQWQ